MDFSTGSQYFPIEIEDEDTVSTPPKEKKRKVDANVGDNELEIIAIEKSKSGRHKDGGLRKKSKHKKKSPGSFSEKTSKKSTFATRKSLEELHQKFTSLESRLESLESCLERVSQVFFNKSFTLESCLVPDENLDGVSEEPIAAVENVENVLENQAEDVNPVDEQSSIDQDASVIIDAELPFINNPSCLNEFENQETSNNVDSIQQNDSYYDVEVPVLNEPCQFNGIGNYNALAAVENAHDDIIQNELINPGINQTDHDDSVPSEAVQETTEELHSAMEFEDEPVDTKWHLLSLPTVKEEVSLHRDDQGRVLMFLSCAFKKFYKPKPGIAATSGVYLSDELKHEFNYASDRKMPEVKIQAEVTSALFGIEMIKELYKNTSVKIQDVCLMVISSCSPLVKIMKEKSFLMVYPNYYLCSCEDVQCNHSETRWVSTHPIGGNHRDILPKLIMTMRELKVHWCLVDNISEDEKKILEKYSFVVQASLNEYFTESKRR